jgi:diadenosine tetraphosphate (Ap4A) HIT family hydrolase
MQTAEQWYERVAAAIAEDGYRRWGASEWTTWPFDGELSVRELQPPADQEPLRGGAGGESCVMCAEAAQADPSEYVFWRDELAMLGFPFDGTSLPFLGFLMPRRHADLSDLTSAEAARLGELQMYLERAVTDVLDVPRVQVYRWGDGNEHLHWWVLGRPAGVLQLRGSFLSHWDDLLPLRDRADLRADLDAVAVRLQELAGGEVLPGRQPADG